MPIDYDPTIESLIRPERRETVLVSGVACSDLQLAVEAARLAYCRAETSTTERARLESALGSVGYHSLQCFTAQTGTQAFAAYHAGRRAALVAFRGTQPDSPQDIAVDAGALPVPWSGGGRVHAGWLYAFESVRRDTERWLATYAAERKSLLICGHSLGAALATIAASAWRPTQLITLGSPRVGDGEFVRSLSGIETRRIVDCCDLVTRVPPRGTYEHTPGLVFITRDGTATQDPPEETIASERMRARVDYLERYVRPGNAPGREFADHAPVNYLRAFFS